MSNPSSFSFILETPAAPAGVAQRHFESKLAIETDPSDVHTDLTRHKTGFVVVDARRQRSGLWLDHQEGHGISPRNSVEPAAVFWGGNAADARSKLLLAGDSRSTMGRHRVRA